MKKEKKKIQVLRRMTEGDIKSLGGGLWMRRRMKFIIPLAVLALVWMVAITQLFDTSGYTALVALLPVLALFVVWGVGVDKAGKKLWNQVKDKEQPVDLG